MSTSKVVLFSINILTFFIGCAVLGLGVFLMTETKDYSGFMEYFETTEMVSKINIASWVFVVFGCLVSLVSFLGCCAVVTSNKRMMYAFASVMTVFIISEFAGSVTVLLYKEPSLEVVETALRSSLETYGSTGDNSKITIAWDNVQMGLECCGIVNASDWKQTPFGQKDSGKNVPDSCCRIQSEGCGRGKLFDPYDDGLHSKGCFEKFENFVKRNLMFVGGAGIAIATIQILMVIAACYLGKDIENQGQYV